MFADKRSVYRKTGLHIDTVEAKNDFFTAVVGRDRAYFAIGTRLIMLNGKTLHRQLPRYAHRGPFAGGSKTELPIAVEPEDGMLYSG